jgi:putative NIF3 family GTP cyclohydrolase 1 type 2
MGITLDALRQHFFSNSPWVDPEQTCDQIIYGSPDREVSKIGTGWMPCCQNLEAAAADGCDLFVSHEVCFYGNWAPGVDSRETPWGKRRMAILDENNMACMNQHDTWDNFPEYGMRDAWREFLGLGAILEERPYYFAPGDRFAKEKSIAISCVEACTLAELAHAVAKRCSIYPASQGITMHGDPDAIVRSVATGVGCHIPGMESVELGADVLVVTFDRAMHTVNRIPMTEMGMNLIVVEHGVAEMPGMARMADYLNKTFEGVEATFYCEEPAGVTVLP